MGDDPHETLPVRGVRVARPTDRLDEAVRFYCEGLGLPRIGGFTDHAGYDGVMIGLPGEPVHLELTHHADGSPGTSPDPDQLLVLYLDDRSALDAALARLAAMGHAPVEPANPYWADHGVTVEDPDGWRIVLVTAS